MKTFIRVSEIWVPDKSRTSLVFLDGLYGPLTDFRTASEKMSFGFDQGLPGKAWSARHPIILKGLESSYFLRKEAAKAAGLSCAVAIPIFAGDFLMAVLVFLCGDDEAHVGAIELWHNNPAESYDLGLVDGYYGTAESFEWVSRRTKFRPGTGLPGMVWKSGLPVVMGDLGHSQRFVRHNSAQEMGITKGLGIPCLYQWDRVYVMTFLSALNTPIARRFEIWLPNVKGEALIFNSGHCDKIMDLSGQYGSAAIPKGEGLLGKVWLSGVPCVTEHLERDTTPASLSASQAGWHSMIAMPIIDSDKLKAIVAWYF